MDGKPLGSAATSSPSRLIVGALILALALLLSLLEGGQLYVRASLEGWTIPIPQVIGRALSSWLLLAALVPGVLYLAARYPVQRAGRAQLPLHLAGSVAFALTHLGGTAFIIRLTHGEHPFVQILSYLFVAYFALDLVIYWGIVGAALALGLYHEARTRELTAARLQSTLSEARLEKLQQQLNPHFLFNTLNGISTLALRGDQEAVTLALSILSDLLRQALSEGTPEVSLARELAFTDGYLEIQRMRFPDRLVIHRDIDPAVLDALVPTMVLQPLVENAIIHGIAPHRGAGQISIQATRALNTLHLAVEDTGPGFQAGQQTGGTGLGLRNTRTRLEQLYGREHLFECGCGAGGGARVTMSIPYRHSKPAAAGGAGE